MLKSNYFSGIALIENSETRLSKFDIHNLLERENDSHQNIISRNFKGIYYKNEENAWLDRIIQNIYFYFDDDLYKKALAFYHFLEGICDYFNWEKNIDYTRKHRPLKAQMNRWVDKTKITAAFYELIDHYKKSHIVISYRCDGIPGIDELIKMVKQVKKNYKLVISTNYKYVLSTNNESHEILLIGWD